MKKASLNTDQRQKLNSALCPIAVSLLSIFLLAEQAVANDNIDEQLDNIEKIEVEGKFTSLIGEAISASQGVIGQQEIVNRPMLRTGEILELVPGMVVTQHSGTGKANQYFLRGFNLDHGTDFASFIDGMPINMRTHGHGQGYTDLNFIIPETIQKITYNKGPYNPKVGDFSGAGSATFSTLNKALQPQISATIGEDNYQRYLLAGNLGMQESHINFALDMNRYDGPWSDIKEDLKKTNALLSYQSALNSGDFKVTLMAYDNSWNSADQIPQRAVDAGIIDELGSLDKSLGGASSRYSISTIWKNDNINASAYYIDYDLNLWSNFTYFLNAPVNGDQFEQVDKRQIYGGDVSYIDFSKWQNTQNSNEFGIEVRVDDIEEVGLFSTRERRRLGAIRNDAVEESSVGIYWQNITIWNDTWKTIVGARYDFFDFDVKSNINNNINGVDLSVNQGHESADNIALKASLIYAINDNWEAYISAGEGFHSNDARGTIDQIAPESGLQITPVDPLVDSFGYEVGLRMNIFDKLNASVSAWQLDLDSELLFVGDAGNTEPSNASSRYGLELAAYYNITNDITLDLEYANTQARFDSLPSNANKIPGALEHVLQAGVAYQPVQGWFGSARLRHFSERPLTEDGLITSDSSTIVNVNIGYKLKSFSARLDILNALNSNDHDIDYFYASRLAGESAAGGVEDIHYHVLEPRTLRLSIAYLF